MECLARRSGAGVEMRAGGDVGFFVGRLKGEKGFVNVKKV